MEYNNTMLGVSLILCGLIFIGISIPLLSGLVPMNRLYGFRIRKAFESEENWHKINKYGAKKIILWSVILVITGIALFFLNPQIGDKIGIWPLVVFVAIPVIQTILYAGKL